MALKHDLEDWVREALDRRGGEAHFAEVAKEIWREHEADLRASGDLFYTWQYDMRWAATRLRRRGVINSVGTSLRGIWSLSEHKAIDS